MPVGFGEREAFQFATSFVPVHDSFVEGHIESGYDGPIGKLETVGSLLVQDVAHVVCALHHKKYFTRVIQLLVNYFVRAINPWLQSKH